MNRNTLKYIAVIAMILDHVALVFVGTDNPLGIAMRTVGRLTAPVMCFFLAEGFMHTRSKKKYGIRLFVFALISQIPFTYLLAGKIWYDKLNMIFTLFFCFMILLCLEKIENRFLRIVCAFFFACLCTYCDWGMVAPLWVIVFAVFRNDKKKMCIFYSLVCIYWVIRCTSLAVTDGEAWYSVLWQAGSLGFIPLINLYNGENGKATKFSKWFFYWFYPVHLLIIAVLYRNILPLI